MEILLPVSVLISVMAVLNLVFILKLPIKKALYYGVGVWVVAIIVLFVSFYNVPVLDTTMGQYIVTIPLGLLIWYVGERLFKNDEQKNTVWWRNTNRNKSTAVFNPTGNSSAAIMQRGNTPENVELRSSEKFHKREESSKQAQAVPVNSEEIETKVEYEFEWVLTTAEQIGQIARYVRNGAKYTWDKQNVNLAYGVADQERHIFLTLIYYLSDAIKRTDTYIDDYMFAFLINGEIYKVSCGIRRGEILDMHFDGPAEYGEMARQAAVFYDRSKPSEIWDALEQANPGQKWFQIMTTLREEYLAEFMMETLGYRDVPDAALQAVLEEFCEILNQHTRHYVFGGKYSVEGFKAKGPYHSLATRLINRERSMWLYFVGCTDSTHAPAGFLESEWLIFHCKGFTVWLDFEENNGIRRFFKLKRATTDKGSCSTLGELKELLQEYGIEPYWYRYILKEALDTLRPNYYLI